MNLREIIARLDKSDSNRNYISVNDFSSAVGIPCYFYNDDLRDLGLSSYWVNSWLCTDTWVGMAIIFYHDEPVCISWQPARKSDVEYHWLSNDARKTVAKAFVEIMLKENETNIISLDEEFGNGFKVNYSSQLLTDTAVFDATGETVEIITKWPHHNTIDLWRKVEIRFPNGERKVVTLDELTINYNLH